MLSTAIYPAFDRRPALFSRAVATDELRGRLGFAGVSITDDLETAAASRYGSPATQARMSTRAGPTCSCSPSPTPAGPRRRRA